jgi:hypothetical protein
VEEEDRGRMRKLGIGRAPFRPKLLQLSRALILVAGMLLSACSKGGDAAHVPAGAAPSYEGNCEVIDCEGVRGWAWDRNLPNAPIKLDVYDGASLAATVTAITFRQDLVETGHGNGSHGFIWHPFTAIKDGRPHTIHVRYSGTNVELHNSPHSVTCDKE